MRYKTRTSCILSAIFIIALVLIGTRKKNETKNFSKVHIKSCTSVLTSTIADFIYKNGNFQQIGDAFQLSPKNSQVYLSNVFPLAYYSSCNVETGTVKVDFKIIDGREDKYAGLVFGLTSEGDYYVVRASASENSVTIAQFSNGNRTLLQTYNANVTDMQWHTLMVIIQNNTISISIDETTITDDFPLKTIGGKIGVNTKSDSVTQFKNLRMQQ